MIIHRKLKVSTFVIFPTQRYSTYPRRLPNFVKTFYQINDPGTVHEPPNPRRLVRGIAAGDPSRRVDRTQCCGVVRANRARIDRQSCMRSSHAPRTRNPEPRVRENRKTESRKTDSGTVCRKTPSGGGRRRLDRSALLWYKKPP